MGDVLNLEAACMGNVFLSYSSSQQPAIAQNVYLYLVFQLAYSVSHITKQGYGVYFDNSNLEVVDINNLQIVASSQKEIGFIILTAPLSQYHPPSLTYYNFF